MNGLPFLPPFSGVDPQGSLEMEGKGGKGREERRCQRRDSDTFVRLFPPPEGVRKSTYLLRLCVRITHYVCSGNKFGMSTQIGLLWVSPRKT